MKEIMKLGLILLIIAAIAGASLGFVNEKTKGPIAEQKRLADIKARQEVLAEADDFQPIDINEAYEGLVKEVNKGTKDGSLVGYTIKAIPKGYAGKVEVLVGIDTNGVITGMTIGDHQETPGFGADAEQPEFKDQYKDKTIDMDLVVTKKGASQENEIDSIAGATITSKAVTKGVNEAMEYFKNNFN